MNIKPKYNDIDTKKPGLPIETPFKYNDLRNKKRNIELEKEENKIIKDNE